jgi:uncharacterized protein (DUF1800 family)
MGARAWVDQQLAKPRGQTHVDWMRAQGYEGATWTFNRGIVDFSVWRQYISGDDQLRQRVVHALSQIFVVAVEGVDGDFAFFATGNLLDILSAHAFGSYRALLEQVTLSPAMGRYLSMLGSQKADASGRRPDENYAREVLQLFSIGLVKLNSDGTPVMANGAPVPSWDENDVSGLARAFTGWVYGAPYSDHVATRQLVPMTLQPQYHETGDKRFLGTVIPAGTSGSDSLRIALDTIAAHPNVGPFIGRQLIQRLVTSNPTPGYVARVAAAFADNGFGVRGDLGATVRAVLLDIEARDAATALASNTAGVLREPVLRFLQWARACGVRSPSGAWKLPSLADPAKRLGQSPLRAPSVFNFFRPGYTPPGTQLAALGLVAPEMQITTETSVAGYLNFMQSAIGATTSLLESDMVADYAEWLPLAGDATTLVSQANLVLCAGQMSTPTFDTVRDAVNAMPAGDAAQRRNRVNAAVLLTMASLDFLVLR